MTIRLGRITPRRRRLVLGATLSVVLAAVGTVTAMASSGGPTPTDPAAAIGSTPAFIAQDVTTGRHFELVLDASSQDRGLFVAAIPGVGLVQPSAPAMVTANADYTDTLSYNGSGGVDAAAHLDPEFGSDYRPSGHAAAATLTLSGTVDPAHQTANLDLGINGTHYTITTTTTPPDAGATVSAVIAALNANDTTALYSLTDPFVRQAITSQQFGQLLASVGTFADVATAGPITYTTNTSDIHAAQVPITATVADASGTSTLRQLLIELADTNAGWALHGIVNPYTAVPDASACSLCVLDPTGGGALSATGHAAINWGGAATVDSTSSNAIQATGNATLFGGSLFTTGGTKLTGPVTLTVQTTASSGTASDPFAGQTTVTAPAGNATALQVSGGSTVAAPGLYSSIQVSGRGQLALLPGVYVVTGHIDVTGNAALTGAGATLYLACANYPAPCGGTAGAALNVSGTATVTLNGGATGTDNQLVLISDPVNAGAITAAGDASLTIVGVLDAAAAPIEATGDARITVIAGSAVARDVAATGNATITVEGQTTAPQPSAPSSPPVPS